MLSAIVRRLLQTVVVVLVMSALVFAGLYMVGDPVLMLASPEATDAQREQIRQALGLHLPLWQQYGLFLAKAFQLDFGASFLTGESARTDRRAAGHLRRPEAGQRGREGHHDGVGVGFLAT